MHYIDRGFHQYHLLFKYTAIALISVVGFSLIPFYFEQFEMTRSELELFTLFNWLFISVCLANILPKGIWSISFIFFTAFSIFHGGLVFVSSVDLITDKDILYVIRVWFHLAETKQAIYLVNYTFIIYAITVLLVSKPIKQPSPITNLTQHKKLFSLAGYLLFAFLGIFFLIAISTGAIFSYSAYLSAVKSSTVISNLFVYLYIFIGLSIVIVASTYQKGFSPLFFIGYGIWAVIAFKLGLRGEVLFPTAVATAILARKGPPIKTYKLVVITLILLMATVVVKNARLSGDYSEIDNLNPLNAIAEMGSSIRTIQETIKWRSEGFERLYGASYWAPFERQIALFLPIERPPAEKDYRLLNRVVLDKVGPIGFSPVAEAYINFGEKGTILVGIVLGLIFAILDRIPSSLTNDIFIGVSIIPLLSLIHISEPTRPY